MTLFHLDGSQRSGMVLDRRAQSLVWGFLAMLVFVAVAAGLVDIYRLYAARNWAYSVAQEAAMTGASRGRDWSSITSGGDMRLNSNVAKDEAQKMVTAELSARGISQYVLDVRVLPDSTGGAVAGFPPRHVRLGSGLGNWSSNEPAVGVYLEVPVNWLMLDMLNTQVKTIRVFAAAGVAQ
jgi:hypothetical protein